MPYDLTDPRQADIVRQKAIARGLSSAEVEKAIKKATQQQYTRQYGYSPTGKVNEPVSELESYGKQLGIKKQELEIGSLIKEQEEANKPDESKMDTLRVVDELLGRNTKPITGLLQIGARIPGNEAQRTKALYNQLKGLLSLENREQLKGSGAISDFEAGLLADSAAALDRNMSDTDFRAELDKVRSVLAKRVGVDLPQEETSGLGLDIGQKKNEVVQPLQKSVSGQIASVGDLVRDETGKLSIMGEVEDDPLMKTSLEGGFRVDNSLVRFLANSEFLPISASVVGGLTGGIAGGAAGAMGGKALQEGLQELLDPDRETMGQHAQAILVEGMVDAVFSGLTLGIGKVGGKAVGLVLKKPGAEVVEQVGKETAEGLSEEAIKAGGKRLPVLGSQEDLLRKAYKLSLNTKADFQKKYGVSYYQKLIDFLEGDLSKLTDPALAKQLAEEQTEQAGKEIGEKIAGRAVKSDVIVPQLEDLVNGVKKEMIVDGKVVKQVPREFKAGVDDLLEKLSELKAESKSNGGFVSLESLQDMKVRLNKAFKGEMAAQSSKELLATGRRELMSTIEKYGGEGIKESNLKYYVFDLLQDSAVKADEKVVNAAFDAMDIIAAGSGTAISGGNVGVGAASLAIGKLLRSVGKDPFIQLGIVNKLGSYAAERGNKNALRAIILSVKDLGIPIGISENLMKQVGKESTKSIIPDEQLQPGLDLQPTQQESFPGLDLGQGGGTPRYLYR